MLAMLSEMWPYLARQRKRWMFPLIVVMAAMGRLVRPPSGRSSEANVYTLF